MPETQSSMEAFTQAVIAEAELMHFRDPKGATWLAFLGGQINVTGVLQANFVASLAKDTHNDVSSSADHAAIDRASERLKTVLDKVLKP